MTLLLKSLARVRDHDLQVSGLTNFPESRWREAILHYVIGIWSGNHSVTYRPKITFGDITLRLDDGEYYACGHLDTPENPPAISLSDPGLLMVLTGKQNDVEVALIRFAKDNRIKQLQLGLPLCNGGTLVLWKKARRSEYGYAGHKLPYSWGTRGPWWTREEFERQA